MNDQEVQLELPPPLLTVEVETSEMTDMKTEAMAESLTASNSNEVLVKVKSEIQDPETSTSCTGQDFKSCPTYCPSCFCILPLDQLQKHAIENHAIFNASTMKNDHLFCLILADSNEPKCLLCLENMGQDQHFEHHYCHFCYYYVNLRPDKIAKHQWHQHDYCSKCQLMIDKHSDPDHFGKNHWSCPLCPFQSAKRSRYQQHLAEKHLQRQDGNKFVTQNRSLFYTFFAREKQCRCDVCDDIVLFNSEPNNQAHVWHYKCDNCTYCTCFLEKLNIHICKKQKQN